MIVRGKMLKLWSITMNLRRRTFLHLSASGALLPAMPRAALAFDYPTRPVHIIVGFAPAGGTDIMARLMGQWLSEHLGQQFTVENRPGAGTNVATEAVVNAPADGYMLLLASLPNASNATLYENLKFNFIRDITPVAAIAREPFAIEVNPSLPVKTVPELIAYAKANPGKINMASGGVGSGNHIFGELFKMITGVNLVHVPYRGAGPALVDLLGGQVQVMFASMSSSIEYVRAGKLRALAVTTVTRSPVLPEIPTVAEFVSGYEASFWTGIGAPKSTPAEIVDKLNRQINAALTDPKVKSRLSEWGASALPGSPADFGELITEETEKWGKVVKFAGIKAE
jgi:tripartite-type tricarboxylate transporter receptor subunit TctC